MIGAKLFEGGWVGWIFLLTFVVFFRPKSVVFMSFNFPSIFTNSFHVVGGLHCLLFNFLFFKFKSKLGLALLCWLAAWVGLGAVGRLGSCFWLGMWLGGLFRPIPRSGL